MHLKLNLPCVITNYKSKQKRKHKYKHNIPDEWLKSNQVRTKSTKNAFKAVSAMCHLKMQVEMHENKNTSKKTNTNEMTHTNKNTNTKEMGG